MIFRVPTFLRAAVVQSRQSNSFPSTLTRHFSTLEPVFRNPQCALLSSSRKALFIADTNNNRIVHLTGDGACQESVGHGQEGNNDGSFSETQFIQPFGLMMHPSERVVYVLDKVSMRKVYLEERVVETCLKLENGEDEFVSWSVAKDGISVESRSGSSNLYTGDKLSNLIESKTLHKANEGIFHGRDIVSKYIEDAGLKISGLWRLGWPFRNHHEDLGYFHDFRYSYKGCGRVINSDPFHLALGRSIIKVDYAIPEGCQLVEPLSLWEVACQGSCVYYSAHEEHFKKEKTTDEEIFMQEFEDASQYHYNKAVPHSGVTGLPLYIPIDGSRGTGEVVLDLCAFIKSPSSNIPLQDYVHLRIPVRFSQQGHEDASFIIKNQQA